LSHPGIVTIYDVGEENDIAFVAMERVSGPSLQQAIASGQYAMDWNNALNILRQAAMALDHAHERGVIHRDIKPANIMLHEGSVVKITDFGIAKIVSASSEYSGTRGTMGTPSYMSPEQIQGGSLDGNSEQFSLAALAFRLLTGTEPFAANSVATSLHKILYEPRPSALALNPMLPSTIDAVLERGLERLSVLRFESCAEFVRAIEGTAYEPAPVLTASSWERFRGAFIAGFDWLKEDFVPAEGFRRIPAETPQPIVSLLNGWLLVVPERPPAPTGKPGDGSTPAG
jgi:serine/threonine-protein kinase